MNQYENVLHEVFERWNAQGPDGYIQTYNQKIDTLGFPGVRPGIERLRIFIKHLVCIFQDHRFNPKHSKGKKQIVCRFSVTGNHDGTWGSMLPIKI